jgi:hypothetical protein
VTGQLRIVVTGLIGQHPLGGVAWDYVQYPVGLARLGHDVWYLEDSGEWPYDVSGPGGRASAVEDCSANVSYLESVMHRFGLDDRWMFRCPIGQRWHGIDESTRTEVLESADLLLNISGSLFRPAEYRSVRQLAYVDSDPGFTQVKLANDEGRFGNRVRAHDVHFTFGERLGPAVPDTGIRWLPTRQPILLGEWQSTATTRPAFTTIMNWASYAAVVHEGQRFGQKNVEFERFIDLPHLVPDITLEVAMRGILRRRKPTAPMERLAQRGWHVVDPRVVCPTLDSYRDYITSSRGEWSVAKHGYVAGPTGWFSCRSACYLAAGRPVAVQDTGFSSVIPTGEGLLAFTTPEEAARALLEIDGDYDRHAQAARDIARDHFDSDIVLGALVDDAMAASR